MIVHPDLSKAIKYVSNTGEEIKWTPLMKLVYAHIMNKNWFFTVKLRKKHFEGQKKMAEDLGSDYQVIGRILRSFRNHGLIDFTTESISGSVQKRCVYTRVSSVLNMVGSDGKVYTANLMTNKKDEESDNIVDFDDYYNIIGR